jgi:hypothetical protein
MTNATGRLVSVPDAAEHVGVHPHTIRNWIAGGKIPTTGKGSKARAARLEAAA